MPCAAQGFPDAHTVANDRGVELVLRQCASCGLIQLTGPPVPYYREVIRAAAFSGSMRAFREGQFTDWVRRYGLQGRRVIELGCGRGEYLSLLGDAGAAAVGIEFAPASVRECRAKGLDVSRGYVGRSDLRLRGAPFDAFVTLNFMEHWPDPVAGLRGILGNLSDRGVGLVEVPNFDMILRDGLFSEFIKDHLLYFTEDTLRFVLQLAGFEVLSCRSVWHDYILSAEVRRRLPLDVDLLERRREEISVALEDFVARFLPGQVAVWGAGHQALAVIALSGVAPKIRYIVDSAPFKQGRFAPSTHIPIVSPETLDRDPVRGVIVMAGSYSDEVVGQLQQRFDAGITIAVLRGHGLEVK